MSEQMKKVFDEAAAWEAKQVEQIQGAIGEMARLSKEAVAYGTQLTAEWRKLTLAMFAPKV